MQSLDGNPLLEAHTAWSVSGRDADKADELICSHSFAVATDQALALVVASSGPGLVEIGAGLGYWAALLTTAGVDVVAYDIAPPPSADNRWFAGREPWHPILFGDAASVADHGDRTLLVVWPTRNELWPAEAIERYRRAGGQQVVYVGQVPGGHTGDDRFHALLGELDRCTACAYGLVDLPCICGTVISWQREQDISLPSFEEEADVMRIYGPIDGPPESHTVVSPDPPARRSGGIKRAWQRARAQHP